MSIRKLKQELADKQVKVRFHPKVVAATKAAREELGIPELEKKIREMEDSNRAKPKPLRWPENTPANILKACEEYWSGTTEFSTFRIHVWNDKGVWTSYPSGGYSTNGGWVKAPAHFHLISLHQLEQGHRGTKVGKVLHELEGRIHKSQMERILTTI